MNTDLNRTTMPGTGPYPAADRAGILSNAHLWQPKDLNVSAIKVDHAALRTNPETALMQFARDILAKAEETITHQAKRIEELEALATHDELTGLYNRRGFLEAFHKECDRTGRGHSEGGLLIMIDLDNFKAINDTYGHQAGDCALRSMAKALGSNIRTMDYAARLGGDEFVLLLTNTALHKVLTRAQNLIKMLNELTIVWYGAEIPIRASLGLQEYKAGDTVQGIFADADVKMYEQKRMNKQAARERERALQS